MQKCFQIAFVTVLALTLLPMAGGAQQFFFIHVPPSTSESLDDVVEGLEEIGQLLENDWLAGNGTSPRVCWLGFSGPWSQGGASQPNNAGSAANALGNANPSDNHTGASMPIDYCAADTAIDHAMANCDIVIAMGEGSPDGFCLEEHGEPGVPPVPDCNGNTTPGGGPVCSGAGCTGTDWDEPTYGGCIDYTNMIGCYYSGDIPVKPGEGAGNFLCGFCCCSNGDDKALEGECRCSTQPISF